MDSYHCTGACCSYPGFPDLSKIPTKEGPVLHGSMDTHIFDAGEVSCLVSTNGNGLSRIVRLICTKKSPKPAP